MMGLLPWPQSKAQMPRHTAGPNCGVFRVRAPHSHVLNKHVQSCSAHSLCRGVFTPRGIPLHSCKFQFYLCCVFEPVCFWLWLGFERERHMPSTRLFSFLGGIIQLCDSEMSFSVMVSVILSLCYLVFWIAQGRKASKNTPLCLFFLPLLWLIAEKKWSIRLVILYRDGFLPVTNGITFYTQKNSLYEPFQSNASEDKFQSMANPMHHIQHPFLPWLMIVSKDP